MKKMGFFSRFRASLEKDKKPCLHAEFQGDCIVYRACFGGEEEEEEEEEAWESSAAPKDLFLPPPFSRGVFFEISFSTLRRKLYTVNFYLFSLASPQVSLSPSALLLLI